MGKLYFAGDPLGYVFSSQWPAQIAIFLNVLYSPFPESTPDWPGLQALGCQQTTRWVAGKVQQATRYFLSSLAGAGAATLAGYVRRHWGIENQQHWHLDVTFAEDASQCRRDHAPRNLSTMRKLALALLRRSPLVMSLKRKRKKLRAMTNSSSCWPNFR